MAGKLTSSGNPLGLQFQIDWTRKNKLKDAEKGTEGGLLLWVHENLAWGQYSESGAHTPIDWTWIELLEYLSAAWPYLRYERGYPLGLNPIWPAKLRDSAESRWQALPDDLCRFEEEQLFAFEDTHDLARGVQGLFLPSVWLVKEGNLMTVGTERATIHRPLDETIKTLSQLGDAIYARIARLEDKRSQIARNAWDNRLNIDPWKFVHIASEWPSEELRKLVGDQDVRAAFEIEENEFEITEPLEIAGLTRGYLGVEQLKSVIEKVRQLRKINTPKLDDLSGECTELLENSKERKPYNQGYQLAHWVREKVGTSPSSTPFDIHGYLEMLAVPIDDIDLGNDFLDAVACWGPRHGPVIWVNRNEKHRKTEGARRTTLSHELCHLLVDRHGALPLADVINGNVPKWVEQRADAFAAELLLPRKVAANAVDPRADIEEIVTSLSRKYNVSRELTAWQIRNSGIDLSPSSHSKLRSMVSDPHDF